MESLSYRDPYNIEEVVSSTKSAVIGYSINKEKDKNTGYDITFCIDKDFGWEFKNSWVSRLM